VELTKLLLEKGANPHFCDSVQHRSCLHYAAQFGWAGCCTILLADTTFYQSRGTSQLLRNTEIRTRDGRTRR